MRSPGHLPKRTRDPIDQARVAAAPPVGDVIPATERGTIGVGAADLELGGIRQLLRERADIVALVMITAVAAGVRFATIDVQSLDHDEAVTAFNVLQPTLGATLSVVSHLERTPPLYYLLAWLWTGPLGVGSGQVDLRLLSALFGTLTVPVAFLAGRELASRRAGVIVAALVALNPFLVWYSQEARAYALLVLLLTLGLFLMARALRHPSRGNLALWALVSALALCTHYFAVFVVAPQAVWLLITIRPRGRPLAAVAATAAAGVALLPLAVMQEGSGRANGFARTAILDRGWQILVHYSSSLEPPLWSSSAGVATLQALAAVTAVVAGIAAAVIVRRRGTPAQSRAALLALGIAAAAFVVPLVVAAVGVDYVDPRNMIGPLVPLLVAGGIALGCSGAGRAGIAAAIGLCVAFVAVLVAVNVTPRMQRPDWRGAAAAIGASRLSRVEIVPRLAAAPVGFYLGADRVAPRGQVIRVRQVDLLSRSTALTRPGPGFRLITNRRVPGGMWLRRYESQHPVRITLHQDAAEKLIHDNASILVTGAPQPGEAPVPARSTQLEVRSTGSRPAGVVVPAA